MKRLTMLAAAAFVLVGSIGCHANRCNTCNSHGSGGGLLGKLANHHHGHQCNVATGCRTCGLGWQHGGLDYSEGLATGNPLHAFPGRQSGLGGHMAAGQQMAGAGVAGPPTAGVAYPYYTVRGPRDFLLDNPPSIGR